MDDEKKALQRAYNKIEEMCIQIIPPHLREGCVISAQEVQCGDPMCSPIDTMVTLMFER